MSYDPNGPDNLTSEQKLFNIKKKLGEMRRFLKKEEPFLSDDALKMVHMMFIAMAEIEREIDRTV